MVLNIFFHDQFFNTNMIQHVGQINRRNCELYPLNRVRWLSDFDSDKKKNGLTFRHWNWRKIFYLNFCIRQ